MAQEECSAALAVYGSLAPGESNHWVVSRIKGDWIPGRVRGYIFEITWGPAEGYQGFIADPEGAEVGVWVLQSNQLDRKWREIDEFEGAGYERRSVKVRLGDADAVDIREIDAQIYVALTDVE